MSEKFVLISGTSTGIGRAAALYLAQRGFSVLAGVRSPEDGKRIESAAAGTNLRSVQLDIANADSIAACIKSLGDIELAGLVNNAGIAIPGPVEFVTPKYWRRQFETNVFGQIALTQATLPMLRKYVARSGKGSARIVFIGSIAGRVTTPVVGPYSASKHALAAVSAALRMELLQQGIFVSLIEPGAIQSEIWRKGDEFASAIPPSFPARQMYGKQIDAVVNGSRNAARGAIPAENVARLIHHCLTSRNPPARKLIGRDAKMAAILRQILPEKLFEKLLMKVLKLD
jgi:NAD(P)-dependent dehydrogenase (short-subunit alcohol dehydrogenase family)